MAARPPGWFVIAELTCTVVVPSVVLLAASSPAALGPTVALVVALAAPAAWAVFTQVRERRVSGLAVISLLSVALSGGIGLAAVDVRWFAWKEALVPAGLGLLVLLTAPTRFALVPVLLDSLLDPERTRDVLQERNAEAAFQRAARRATVLLGLVSLASAVGSFVLARALVASAPGTATFGTELGFYTALSFPAVTLPVLAASVWVLRRALIDLEEVAGVGIEELLR